MGWSSFQTVGAVDGLSWLQGGGDNLGGRRGAAVDQHDERPARGEVAGAGVVALETARMAARGRDDAAPGQEQIGDLDRLVEQGKFAELNTPDSALGALMNAG